MGTTPAEVFKPLTGLTIERKALRPDSGGAGEFRGGPGQTIVLRNDSGHDMSVFSMANRTLFPAKGLFGGGPGALREHWIDGHRLSGEGAARLAPASGCASSRQAAATARRSGARERGSRTTSTAVS